MQYYFFFSNSNCILARIQLGLAMMINTFAWNLTSLWCKVDFTLESTYISKTIYFILAQVINSQTKKKNLSYDSFWYKCALFSKLGKINSIVYKINVWYKANQISTYLKALKYSPHTQWNFYSACIHFLKIKTTYSHPTLSSLYWETISLGIQLDYVILTA